VSVCTHGCLCTTHCLPHPRSNVSQTIWITNTYNTQVNYFVLLYMRKTWTSVQAGVEFNPQFPRISSSSRLYDFSHMISVKAVLSYLRRKKLLQWIDDIKEDSSYMGLTINDATRLAGVCKAWRSTVLNLGCRRAETSSVTQVSHI